MGRSEGGRNIGYKSHPLHAVVATEDRSVEVHCWSHMEFSRYEGQGHTAIAQNDASFNLAIKNKFIIINVFSYP